MIVFEESLLSLAVKDKIVIRGVEYQVKNVVYATDGEVLKARFLLKSDSNKLDIAISAKVVK